MSLAYLAIILGFALKMMDDTCIYYCWLFDVVLVALLFPRLPWFSSIFNFQIKNDRINTTTTTNNNAF